MSTKLPDPVSLAPKPVDPPQPIPLPVPAPIPDPAQIPPKDITVTLQNISVSHVQKSWVSMGLPPAVAKGTDGWNGCAKTADNRKFPAHVRGMELFVQATLLPNEKLVTDVQFTDQSFVPYAWSDWVMDQPEKLLPNFVFKRQDGTEMFHTPMAFWTGIGPKPDSYFTFEEDLELRKRVFFRTMIDAAPLVIEGWVDLYSGQDVAPIIVRASYGTVASERLLNKPFGSLSMFVGEKPIIDFRKQKGLSNPIWRGDKRTWEVEIATPKLWWKSRVIETFGALLCLPPYEDLGTWAQKESTLGRWNTLLAREEAPIMGIAHVWEGNWLAFGKVPEQPFNMASAVKRAYDDMARRHNTISNEYAARAYAQPASSGQTGAQPDFGASRCELAVTAREPFALWDYRFSVQAWMLRPYAHKTSKGDRDMAKNHPGTLLWNMAPDSRFGNDLLGWPNPIPYNEFWTGSDNQHRSDNLLLGMFALTRDPSIRATVEDLVQTQLMELKTWVMFGQPASIESPRGWGRPLISMAHLVSLGYEEVKPYMDEMVDVMHRGAFMRTLPADPSLTVRTLSRFGSKYGWVNTDGSNITAWVCWEETIAAMGLYAVYKVTGNQKARELALEIARTATRHAFFKSGSTWLSCYAVKFDETNPGRPLPDSAYFYSPREEDNKNVFVYGIHQWILPALRILQNEEPNDPATPRAREILDWYGRKPGTFEDSAWWAV